MFASTGKVVFFNSTPSASFGFICPTGCDPNVKETNVFFHLNGLVGLSFNGTHEPIEVMRDQLPGQAIFPKSGDVLCFNVTPGNKGPRAMIWAFKSNVDAVMELIASRQYFRVQRRVGAMPRNKKEHKPEIQTVYEGYDLEKLHLNLKNREISDKNEESRPICTWVERYIPVEGGVWAGVNVVDIPQVATNEYLDNEPSFPGLAIVIPLICQGKHPEHEWNKPYPIIQNTQCSRCGYEHPETTRRRKVKEQFAKEGSCYDDMDYGDYSRCESDWDNRSLHDGNKDQSTGGLGFKMGSKEATA